MPFAFTRPSLARSTNGFMRSAGYAVGRFMGSDSISAHAWPSCARQKARPFGMVHSLFLQVEATARRKPSDWVERTYRRSLATSWLKWWKLCSDSNSDTAFSVIWVLPLGTRRRAPRPRARPARSRVQHAPAQPFEAPMKPCAIVSAQMSGYRIRLARSTTVACAALALSLSALWEDSSSRRRSRRPSRGMDSGSKIPQGRAQWPCIPQTRNSRNSYCPV